MTLLVPLQAVPNQTLTINLINQATQINLIQRIRGMFISVYLNNSLIVSEVLCQNKNRIIRDAYFGYQGDFEFVDTQGTADPEYTGLGDRYFLIYLEVSDLP